MSAPNRKAIATAVTPRMAEAGARALRDLLIDGDLAPACAAIYSAMEDEGLSEHAFSGARPGYDEARAPAAHAIVDALAGLEAAILTFIANDGDALLEEIAHARRARLEFAAAGART